MKQIGKYTVISGLVKTDFSDIYLCQDPVLDADVAIKVFNPKGKNVGKKAKYGPKVWRARFIEEARLLARLDHPYIVAVRDLAFTEDDKPFFVMPYYPANLIYEIGKDVFDEEGIAKLKPQWRPRRLAVKRAITVLRQVLAALAFLHHKGLVHRDIKPGNVLLTEKGGGSVKLCDFGMVKQPETSSHSRSGIWIGTLDYIAPEQRRSAREVDAHADVYSAGALAYRMLTGTLPVGAFPPPHKMVPEIPRGVSNLIMRSLNRAPANRPFDAGMMLRLLNKELIARKPLLLDPKAKIKAKVTSKPKAVEQSAVAKTAPKRKAVLKSKTKPKPKAKITVKPAAKPKKTARIRKKAKVSVGSGA
ncbi:MAG: serine/threonine protein kinase [Rhodospirillales bacterium]|nr:serine/threonine protein kinase [Rhodospirillales bacterium]